MIPSRWLWPPKFKCPLCGDELPSTQYVDEHGQRPYTITVCDRDGLKYDSRKSPDKLPGGE